MLSTVLARHGAGTTTQLVRDQGPVGLQKPRPPKLQAPTIPQAYAYHKLLVKKVTGPAVTDDQIGYDAFDDDSDQRDDSSSDDDPDDQCLVRQRGHHDDRDRSIQADGLEFRSCLLSDGNYHGAQDDDSSPSSSCANSGFRAGLWATNPNFISELTESKAAFLSQLAYLCIEARVRRCSHGPCVAVKQTMAVTAPDCGWTAFREWALVCMSCQAGMGEDEKLSRAHTHLARAISGCCRILKRNLIQANRKAEERRRFAPGKRGESRQIHLAHVASVVYWMAGIQSQMGIGPSDRFDGWPGDRLLLSIITLPAIERAAHKVEGMGICKTRFWSLINASDRKQHDLPDIAGALEPHKESLQHDGHGFCTPSKCQWAQMNSTSVTRLHKCDRGNHGGGRGGTAEAGTKSCHQKRFPTELLETALELGKSTAWLCRSAKLSGPGVPYVAISHVWSDGTGVGPEDPGTVNSCLFDFFADIAQRLGCEAIWWDALSIPTRPKARSKALNVMHANYANAEYTVVHDAYLLNFPWGDDGSPCVALVLSTWFTRGWTALELAMSKRVKVLFRDPTGQCGGTVIKDLDEDVLARGPGVASRAHWLATTLVRRLRRPIGNVGDLLAILSCRSTSWARDRAVIAALLAGVPDCDFTLGESLITAEVLKYVGKIPYACLFHGKPTMRSRGGFSWCAATLEDMPVESPGSGIADGPASKSSRSSSYDVLEIDETGAVEGKWRCRTLSAEDVDRVKAYGNDLAAVVKVKTALLHWERCLLLRHPRDQLLAMSEESLALLVVPTSLVRHGPLLKCRYIGAVFERSSSHLGRPLPSPWSKNHFWTVRLGGTDNGSRGMRGCKVEDLMRAYSGNGSWDKDEWNDDSDDDDDHDASVKADDSEDESLLHFGEVSETGCAASSAWGLDSGLGEELGNSRQPESPNARVLEVDSTPPQASREHLITALRTNNEAAARYLVSNGVDLEGCVPLSLIAGPSGLPSEKALVGVKMLGDIYSDHGRLDCAIKTYRCVIDSHYHNFDRRRPMHRLSTKYSLANVHLRQAKMLEQSGEEGGGGDGLAEHLDNAQRLFEEILEECKQPKRQRRGARHVGMSLKLSAAHTQNSNHAPEDKKEVVNRIGDEERWYRLELDTIAELALLQVAKFRFDDAAEVYKQALRKFGGGAAGDIIEAFSSFRSSCHGLAGLGKGEDGLEAAAAVYQRALGRFNTMFHTHHILIAITSLNLGVNYMLRSKHAEAEVQLSRAYGGIVKHFWPSATDKAAGDLSRTWNQEHAILGLTRFNLGLLFCSQQRLDDAELQLQQARKMARPKGVQGASAASDDATLIRLSADYALSKVELLRQKPDFDKVTTLLETILETAKTQKVARPLIFRATLGQAKVRYFRDCDSSAAVDLCKEAISMSDRQTHDQSSRLDGAATDVCEARAFLGAVYESQGRLAEAEKEVELALKGLELLGGVKTLPYLQAAVQISSIYAKKNDMERAERVLGEAYSSYVETMGAFCQATLQTSLSLGRLYLDMKTLNKAEEACERARHGFDETLGPNHRSTAEAARALGAVYFAMGKLGKSKAMYEQAFSAFSNVSTACSELRNNGNAKKPIRGSSERRSAGRSADRAAVVTDEAALLCAMDLAGVYAAFREVESKKKAKRMYLLAIRGFRGSGKWHSMDGNEAKLRYGRFCRERMDFTRAEHYIVEAREGFRRLADGPSGSRPARVKYLEAQLCLGQLRLDKSASRRRRADREEEEEEEEEEDGDDLDCLRGTAEAEELIENAREELVELLGDQDALALEASLILGHLWLQDSTKQKEGKEMLESVLGSDSTGGGVLSPGHPKKFKVMEILIAFSMRQEDAASVSKWKDELWKELVRAYDVDLAAMIMDMTGNLRQPIGCPYEAASDTSDGDTDFSDQAEGLCQLTM
ncbi:hypothetical protein QBC42DRAFT_223704 [Cladorrhinum samala]|uniref:Uncharacterized protein n=1 Tax=Cladorrhinum samala TaxID=585594 RepID=A0AAV9HU74_9PEZI|nr:hypothetical protein QBC42DRAFT_223704 [Cladorrhinum samala]